MMTEADGTPPSAEETANYTERLLAALTRLLGDEDSAQASMGPIGVGARTIR